MNGGVQTRHLRQAETEACHHLDVRQIARLATRR
jgi:hypothetical protein